MVLLKMQLTHAPGLTLVNVRAHAQQQLKVFISIDMEGVAGVVHKRAGRAGGLQVRNYAVAWLLGHLPITERTSVHTIRCSGPSILDIARLLALNGIYSACIDPCRLRLTTNRLHLNLNLDLRLSLGDGHGEAILAREERARHVLDR